MRGWRTRFRIWLIGPDRGLRSVGRKLTVPGNRTQAIKNWREQWAPAWVSQQFGPIEEGWKPAEKAPTIAGLWQ